MIPWLSRFMFDDDGHIWHSSGECLGIKGDQLKRGKCETAEFLVWNLILQEAFFLVLTVNY